MNHKTATVAVSGASGFITLTNADSPYTLQGLSVAMRTVDSNITISGDQASDHPLAKANPYVNYEVDPTGVWDPIYGRDLVITIPAGSVRVALGEG